MSRVYDHPKSEAGHCVGHTGPDGSIYSHPDAEAGYRAGHVGGDGRIYSQAERCVGRVGGDGKIYSHPDGETERCVGHVGANGRIYSHPRLETGRCVGHVDQGCPLHHAGGAALLLLLKDTKAAPREEKPEKPRTNPFAGGSGHSGGGWFGKYLLIAAVILLLAVAILLLQAAPVTLCFVCLLLVLYVKPKYRKYTDQGIPAPQEVDAAKANARSWALAGTMIPLIANLVTISLVGAWHALLLVLLPLDLFFLYTFIWQEMVMGRFPNRPLFRLPQFQGASKGPKAPKPPKNDAPPPDPNYNFFTCPRCRAALRVPKGKGRIKITCPKCGEKFLAQD